MVRADDPEDPATHALEQALAAEPANAELLAVYADALIARGDPRGELISLEQRVHGRPDPAIEARLREVLLQLFDGPVPPGARLRHGFLELDLDTLAHDTIATDLLDQPIARTLRRLRVVLNIGTNAAALLERVLATEWPHLTELVIGVGYTEPDDRVLPALDARLLPRLRTLHLFGRVLLEPGGLPTLTTLRLDDRDAVTWALGSEVHAGVTTLDVLDGHEQLADELAAQLVVQRFPRIDTLDLSRNEPPTWPPPFGVLTSHQARSIFRWVRRAPLAQQIRRIVLPSLRDDNALATARWLVESMPALEEVVVARSYTDHATRLVRPGARVIVPAIVPWPQVGVPGGIEALAIEMPGGPFTGHVMIPPMIAAMEAHYDDLPDAARDAWDALWDAVGRLPLVSGGHGPRMRFPAALLAAALDALPSHVLARHHDWARLRRALGPHPSRRLDVTVAPYRPAGRAG